MALTIIEDKDEVEFEQNVERFFEVEFNAENARVSLDFKDVIGLDVKIEGSSAKAGASIGKSMREKAKEKFVDLIIERLSNKSKTHYDRNAIGEIIEAIRKDINA